MKWNDLIETIMEKNDGIASLNYLYDKAHEYKELPSSDWKKTLRGVLYRDVKRGRFKKIGLGVYAIQNYKDQFSAYSHAVQNKSIDQYLDKLTDFHSAIEGMLIEIGNFFEFKTYTSDINKKFDGKKLSELCEIKEIPDFTYHELKEIISKCDVIWFNKNKMPFPKFIFEVESTTDFTNSMLKMYQMLDFNTKFYLVAPDKRKNTFFNRVKREPFVSVKEKFQFRGFEEVTKLYFSSVEHYELKTNFLL